jgi:1-phosphofructokinase
VSTETWGVSVPASVVVFAPDPLLTVTVEAGVQGDEIHVHPGGQGFWIARMVASLGMAATLVGPFGGETGRLARHLIADTDITVVGIEVGAGNGAYVHDRRDGTRVELASMRPDALSRHGVDDLYGAALTAALDAGVAVLAGPGPWEPAILPVDVYRRLASDLRANAVTVVADLSGAALVAALAGGVDLLKISHQQLLAGGYATTEDRDNLIAGMQELHKGGAECVIVSRAELPTLALLDDRVIEVHGPRLEPVEPRGGGDSMTAGVATGIARGLDPGAALRLGAAAGALNVTRRGLASGGRTEIEVLADRLELRELPSSPERREPE